MIKRRIQIIFSLLTISTVLLFVTTLLLLISVFSDKNDDKNIAVVEIQQEYIYEPDNTQVIDEEETLDSATDEIPEEENEITDLYKITVNYDRQCKEKIASSNISFADKKITVLGDSLTYGYLLPDDERKDTNLTGWIKKITGSENVVNLGITGSTVSKCYDRDPMCKRYSDIPEDSDIIVVYGGTNDMLLVERNQFGTFENLEDSTFYGDLNTLISGIVKKYPKSQVLVVNPTPTGYSGATFGMNPKKYLGQSAFTRAISDISQINGVDELNLYDMNVLSSYSREVLDEFYLVDELHMNGEGYRVLAELIVAKLIDMQQ